MVHPDHGRTVLLQRKRVIKDTTKSKTDDFDPELFKHDGFNDHDAYLERACLDLA